jgi:CHAD domain-containing protein
MDQRPANAWALQTVRRLWADFMAREPGTLRGEDPEQLHRMRVAHRRLRTAIGSFSEVLPAELVAADDELRWIGQELGAVRDLDVQLEAMRDTAGGLEATPQTIETLLAAVNQERQHARQRMLEALVSKRFEGLVLRIARSLREQVTATSIGIGPTIGELAPTILADRYRRFRKAARPLRPKSLPLDYHEARRRARRLRFATEFVEEIYRKPAEELIEAATELQDVFGDHQDCYAAIELRARVCASLPEPAATLARELDERDLERAASLRKAAPDAIGKVQKRWRALKKAMSA